MDLTLWWEIFLLSQYVSPMQPFVLYNSEQRKKVEFVPRKEGHIDMYVCGMTVYDYCHIGHARVMVAFDYIIRFLRSQGWNVKYVRNITDIDDKIIKRANENGESITALTDRFIQAMNEDAENLGCLHPDEAPRATEYIDQMQSMIGDLVDKGTAYHASNGDVYFQVENLPNMVAFQVVNLKTCKQVLLNALMLKLRKNIRLILSSGNMPKKMNLLGLRLGAMAVQAGILNVQLCRLAA